jgi:hypothetical protein
MPQDADKSSKGFQELIRVLEEAVQARADCLELEWEGQDLVVYQYFGHTGVGAVSIPRELQKAVLREIAKRAKLAHKPTGTMPLTLLGNEYEVFVQEYDSFGESTFTLRR